jgi:dTDP-glucose 4,6-dehydratase
MASSFPPLPGDDLKYVIERTRNDWDQMRGGRIFVTGATGFFGVWLLETFAYANQELGLGAELLGLTRNPEAFYAKVPHLASLPDIRLLQGDVRDFKFPEGTFTHVIHAGTTSGAPVPPLEMLDTIIQGTRRTLDFAVAARAKRFLFVSSGAVYGKQSPDIDRIPETYLGGPDTLNPVSSYDEGKRVAEMLCHLYHHEHGVATTVARSFALVGPRLPLDAHFAMGNFLRDAMKGEPILVKDGTPERSYLYAADLAIWLWTILFRGTPCHPYNVGSDHAISISQLAKTVARLTGGTVQLPPTSQSEASSSDQLLNFSISQQSAPPRPSSRYVPDTNRIMSELALEEIIGLEEAIRRTLHYYTTAA